MWKPEHRAAADRRGLRYESDLTDAEWALVAPLIRPAKRGGRPRTVDIREVLNAIFYVLWTGCQWKALPKDLPPRSTVWEYLDLWDWDGTLGRIHHALYVEVREKGDARRARRRRSSTARPPRAPSTYGPPRLQAASALRSEQSASTYPVSGFDPGQDGDPRVPVLIKGPASSAI